MVKDYFSLTINKINYHDIYFIQLYLFPIALPKPKLSIPEHHVFAVWTY